MRVLLLFLYCCYCWGVVYLVFVEISKKFSIWFDMYGVILINLIFKFMSDVIKSVISRYIEKIICILFFIYSLDLCKDSYFSFSSFVVKHVCALCDCVLWLLKFINTTVIEIVPFLGSWIPKITHNKLLAIRSIMPTPSATKVISDTYQVIDQRPFHRIILCLALKVFFRQIMIQHILRDIEILQWEVDHAID